MGPPQVCSTVRVPHEPIQQELMRNGLNFWIFHRKGADDSELSVLTRADCYCQVVSDKVEQFTKSLVAAESGFGQTLQRPLTTLSVTDATCMHISVDS